MISSVLRAWIESRIWRYLLGLRPFSEQHGTVSVDKDQVEECGK